MYPSLFWDCRWYFKKDHTNLGTLAPVKQKEKVWIYFLGNITRRANFTSKLMYCIFVFSYHWKSFYTNSISSTVMPLRRWAKIFSSFNRWNSRTPQAPRLVDCTPLIQELFLFGFFFLLPSMSNAWDLENLNKNILLNNLHGVCFENIYPCWIHLSIYKNAINVINKKR